jgi:hypothetical protein
MAQVKLTWLEYWRCDCAWFDDGWRDLRWLDGACPDWIGVTGRGLIGRGLIGGGASACVVRVGGVERQGRGKIFSHPFLQSSQFIQCQIE